MSDDSNKSLDALGLKPLSESIRIATQAAVDGAAAFLSRVCIPVSEEFGLLLRDRVHAWRSHNLTLFASKAEQLLEDRDVHAHPRIASKIIEEASWMEDTQVRDMWAGLLASSCSEAGDDDSNLIFIELLSRLSRMQCLLLDYSCKNSKKFLSPNHLPFSRSLKVSIETLHEITACSDIERIDRELDNLRDLGLINSDGGFHLDDVPQTEVDIAPSALAIHLHIRCQGSRESPKVYHDLKVEPVFEETATTAADDPE